MVTALALCARPRAGMFHDRDRFPPVLAGKGSRDLGLRPSPRGAMPGRTAARRAAARRPAARRAGRGGRVACGPAARGREVSRERWPVGPAGPLPRNFGAGHIGPDLPGKGFKSEQSRTDGGTAYGQDRTGPQAVAGSGNGRGGPAIERGVAAVEGTQAGAPPGRSRGPGRVLHGRRRIRHGRGGRRDRQGAVRLREKPRSRPRRPREKPRARRSPRPGRNTQPPAGPSRGRCRASARTPWPT